MAWGDIVSGMSQVSLAREHAEKLDADDPLAGFRDRFALDDPSLVYLNGNSLGALPRATLRRLETVVREEWGTALARSWDHWVDLPGRAGDVVGRLTGAAPGQVLVADNTTVNLYKLACAALDARPGRHVIVTDQDNFPSDRYVLEGISAQRGTRLRMLSTDIDQGLDPAEVRAAVDEDTALVSLSHVAYRSGAVADLAAITAAAHRAGALVLWDLCHSAGAVPVELSAAAADLAVGCTYKHLNAGPGGPAFLYVRRDLQAHLEQPIHGWFGQRDQFLMRPVYQPETDIRRFLAGTPGVLGMVAALEGARLTATAGVPAIAAKARALGTFALALADAWLSGYGVSVASPRRESRRGAQVALRHPRAWQLCQALRDAGVVPDFRAPDRLRLGLAPLYTRYLDVYEAMYRLRDILATGRHLGYPAQPTGIT